MTENYNYWNDSRTIAGMVSKEKIDCNHIIWKTEDDTGEEVIHRLRCRWAVCPTCDGNGVHVNPSVDASGISSDNFYDDPDFAEDYLSGAHDVNCNECSGKRVVPVIDERSNPKELIEAYQQYRQACYDDARVRAQERSMGA